MVAEGFLDVQIFSLAGPGTVINVTDEYLEEGNVIYYDENNRHYTMCSIETTTRALSLIVVWHNSAEQQFYYASYFIKKTPIIVPTETLRQM